MLPRTSVTRLPGHFRAVPLLFPLVLVLQAGWLGAACGMGGKTKQASTAPSYDYASSDSEEGDGESIALTSSRSEAIYQAVPTKRATDVSVSGAAPVDESPSPEPLPGSPVDLALRQQGPQQAATASGEPELAKKLVVEGWLDLAVDNVAETAASIRGWVEGAGGRVIEEQLSGGDTVWSGRMRLEVPPQEVDAILSRVSEKYEITSKRIQGTDVSRTLYDQEIALENLTLTLDRLRKLLDRQGLDMKDILAIEQEMTRLRGEIERIKGEKRWLEHRVALATLYINISRREGAVLRPQAKLYPGPRLTMLTLLDPGSRKQTSLGGGVVVHVIPRLTMEFDVFEGPGDKEYAALATFGGATYSDFLGRGKRRFLNPYLGLRLGFGYVDGSRFVFGGGGGIELFKHEYVLVDANVNVLGLAGEEFDAAVVGSTSIVFAF